MVKEPLISVIVPIYNVEDYLGECLDSIINQSYENLEIILINDGTPDNSAEICREYAARDNRIVFLEKENGGLSSARNFGLDHATGDYISFIDSDDFIHEDYFKILIEYTEDHELIFCNFSAYYANQPQHEITIEDFNSFESVTFTSTELLKQISTFKRPLVIVAWAKLYKKELWTKLRYPIGKTHEDEYVVHHFIDKAKKIKFIDLPLYYYRQDREGSIMHTQSEKKIRDYYNSCLDREQFFLQKGMKKDAKATYNNGKSYLIRHLLKIKIKNEDNSFKAILKDSKLSIATKLELLFKRLIK
ncbi:glycosyltransferase [Myroides sp. M-43]|uniref:glycosyltransferase family 2 protein n=1 Tax=Myroides oncorhynchi TaxID=2893756 RepID=UPI001E32615C|nr:glycosyltransferase [Myroides oncorhynchi]MCC9043476.1 glycosyltransferase [Myroides oncorhynchi]